MAKAPKEVRWTSQATSRFDAIMDYIEREWSEREADKFQEATARIISYIRIYPRIFRRLRADNVYEALITPHNLLIYKVYPARIDIITIWDTRQHPRKKPRFK